MKSIKPGRGPSMMSAIGSAAVALFGVFWTMGALWMGAPFFFPLFGVVFVLLGIAQAVYSFRNATSENRYSAFDITDGHEEPDPLHERYHRPKEPPASAQDSRRGSYCTTCGARAEEDHVYCKACGKKLG